MRLRCWVPAARRRSTLLTARPNRCVDEAGSLPSRFTDPHESSATGKRSEWRDTLRASLAARKVPVEWKRKPRGGEKVYCREMFSFSSGPWVLSCARLPFADPHLLLQASILSAPELLGVSAGPLPPPPLSQLQFSPWRTTLPPLLPLPPYPQMTTNH